MRSYEIPWILVWIPLCRRWSYRPCPISWEGQSRGIPRPAWTWTCGRPGRASRARSGPWRVRRRSWRRHRTRCGAGWAAVTWSRPTPWWSPSAPRCPADTTNDRLIQSLWTLTVHMLSHRIWVLITIQAGLRLNYMVRINWQIIVGHLLSTDIICVPLLNC